jgi:CubicO group peptidase (beta-lactamase class C family)
LPILASIADHCGVNGDFDLCPTYDRGCGFDMSVTRACETLVVVLLASSTVPAFSQEARGRAPATIENLMSQLHERGQFNGEILVAQRGKILYRGAFGLSDQKSGQTFTPDTPSCLASLSKPLTAVAVMMLAERRGLAYDDPLAKYFPELPDAMGAATIRQLLTHTSGIPDYSDLNVEHPGMVNAEVLNALRGVDKPLFPPGERYRYSNSGYVLLGLVVERVSGQPLSRYLQDRIFKPLGMKNSFALTSASQKTGAVARGYNAFGTTDDYDAYVTGDGGVYSTVNDLFAFDQALHRRELVNQQSLDEAFTPGSVREGKTTYGFGWNVESDASGRRVWHTGNTAGFRAFIEHRLDQQIAVIMLTNGGNSKRVEINQAIHSILAGLAYSLPKRSIAVALHDVVLRSGFEAAIAKYRTDMKAHGDEYDLDEGEINALGYQLLYQDRRQGDAVQIFLLNTAEHPSSSNAFDSLAEAYQVMGDKGSARKYYEVALQKDPQNLHARSMLEKLQR